MPNAARSSSTRRSSLRTATAPASTVTTSTWATDGRRWPWGNDWVWGRANIGGEKRGEKNGFLYAAPVGSFPGGRSPFGCFDMPGNVWEWTADWYDDRIAVGEGTPGLREPRQGREKTTRRVVRGGGWSGTMPGQARFLVRTTTRSWSNPSYWHPDVGFRCAKNAT